MSESLSFKMRVICTVLTVYLWVGIYGQINEGSSENTLINGQNRTNKTFSEVRNYYYDPQVSGFNSSKITSGPIVLTDKRTLFISNLQYRGSENVLVFSAGVGSPYSDQRQPVAEKYFSANHTNVYIRLPENLTLDVVDFIGVSEKNSLLLEDYVIFEKINRSTIRNYEEEIQEYIIHIIPKCCQHNEYIAKNARGCIEADEEINLDINIFESNETGLDPDVRLNASNYELRPYFQGLKCNENEYRLEVGDELHGLIYNSSLIIQGGGILSHGEFCFESIEDDKSYTTAFYCYPKPIETSDPNLYLPVLIISTICFAISAGAYGIILKPKDISKICFIAFSSLMCLTFLSLIILQVQGNVTTCNIFGFVFIFSTVLSFLWLLILCLELLYLVRIPVNEKRNDNRWYYYIGVSLGISILLCFISMVSGEMWIPDVPNSFVKSYGNNKCQFETAFARSFITFVPMILSIVLSIISLVVLRSFIKKNESSPKIKNHTDWMENQNTYKFLSRTYVIIIVVASFWLLNLAFYSYELGSTKTQLALDIIEASLGVVTLIAFVLNKYTLAEIKEKIHKKEEPVTEEELGLNGISTPDTPATYLDDPFDQPSYRNPNLTSFGNHR